MRDLLTIIRTRRVAVTAALLFCFSFGESQVRIDRSMFRADRVEQTDLSSMMRLQQHLGVAANINTTVRDLQIYTSSSNALLPDTQSVVNDSLRIQAGSVGVDTQASRKSPTLAMLMSMVIPGSGQIYVHRYITIPIIWGFGYYFVKAWIDQNNQYKHYRDLFAASVKTDTLGQGNGVLQSNRDFYRDDRDKFAFYIAITYILNIVDAYVGASLYSFDVSDNLGGSAAIRFRVPIQ